MKKTIPALCVRTIRLLPTLFGLLTATSIYAGSATWNLSPTSGDWNTAANWMPATVPDGIDQTATFGVSSIPNVTTSDGVDLGDLVFDPGASGYSINSSPHNPLTFSGTGIVNNSGVRQHFNISFDSGIIAFFDRPRGGHPPAGAGIDTVFTVPAGATLQFSDDTSADHGTFSGSGDVVFFSDSTAADGIFTIKGPAGVHTISFTQATSAGNSTLIATSDGIISFEAISIGETARVELFDGGTLRLYTHAKPGLTIGSLEGDGVVLLGSTLFNHAAGLTIGSNNLDTAFSGLIDDAGLGGSIRKIGTGALILSNANLYTGGTIVSGGRLVVNNTAGSGTGSGPVQIVAGTLGGNGMIGGPVAIGTGGRRKAAMGPGTQGLGLLTAEAALTFGSNGSYNWDLDTETSQADGVVAQGVTIDSAAVFTIYGRGNSLLPQGTIFTALNNMAATPISGTFSNLPAGATLTVGSNHLQANYEGGDGNDLTLTVVP